jgi:hypothetical protein
MKKAARSKRERTADKMEEQVKVPSSYYAAALRSSNNVKHPGGLFADRCGSSGPRKRADGQSIH